MDSLDDSYLLTYTAPALLSHLSELDELSGPLKLVGSDLNAVKELSDVPGMTSWAYNILVGHRNEITDARRKVPDWTGGPSVGFTVLYRCKKCGLMPKDGFMWFPMRKEEPARSRKLAPGAVAHAAVPSEHDTDTCVVMQYGDEDETCKVFQAEYPPPGKL